MTTLLQPSMVDPLRVGEGAIYAESIVDGAALLVVRPSFYGEWLIESYLISDDEEGRTFVPVYSVQLDQSRIRTTGGVWFASVPGLNGTAYSEKLECAAKVISIAASLMDRLNAGDTPYEWTAHVYAIHHIVIEVPEP